MIPDQTPCISNDVKWICKIWILLLLNLFCTIFFVKKLQANIFDMGHG